MDNRDKIIRQISSELKLPITNVTNIVMSPFDLLSKTILTKSSKSVYIRKVGMFLSPEVRTNIMGWQREYIEEKIAQRNLDKSQDEDPINFN